MQISIYFDISFFFPNSYSPTNNLMMCSTRLKAYIKSD